MVKFRVGDRVSYKDGAVGTVTRSARDATYGKVKVWANFEHEDGVNNGWMFEDELFLDNQLQDPVFTLEEITEW